MGRKKALITGASRGIGKAIAQAFAGAGYDLYLTCYTNSELLEEFGRGLEKEYHVSCRCYSFPISDEKSVIEMYQDIDTLQQREGAGRECYERLVAGLSLYRPGPLDEIPNYIRYMLNPSLIQYEIPQMEKHLKNTYSVITYQEQVMAIST